MCYYFNRKEETDMMIKIINLIQIFIMMFGVSFIVVILEDVLKDKNKIREEQWDLFWRKK